MEKYSVLMSVYCKEKAEYFRQAIDSMLAQTVAPDEFVLVCDGPLTPELDAVIDGYEQAQPELFKVVRLEENRGLGVALSIGLQECRNELVARMDTDDISLPDRMEKQLAVIGLHPEVSAVGGQIAEFYDDPNRIIGYRVVPLEHEKILERAATRNPMNHVTVVYRKSKVLQAGNYPNHPGFEDYHLWARMLSKGQRFMNTEEVLCNVRADAGMHERRRGVAYFRHTWNMERVLLSKGLTRRVQFCKNVAVRFMGTVVLSGRLRQMVFQNTMRRAKI